MGQPYIPESESSYYPLRARWYAFIFVLGDMLRHRMAMDKLSLPSGVKISELVVGFLVPGVAVWLRGPRYWGLVAMAACTLLGMVFVVGLGHSAANLAFGMLISLHVTGFVFYCQPLLNDEPFWGRLRFTFLAMLAVAALLYWPTRSYVLGRWLTPLRLHGQVMVVQRQFEPRKIQRGDWVAYTLERQQEGPHGNVVVLNAGMGLGPVLAVPGDQVQFGTNGYSVNGLLQTNLWRMPTAGGFTVSEKNWFIWPDLGISGYGHVQEASIDSVILDMASVNFTNFYGKPFHRWFGRKQF